MDVLLGEQPGATRKIMAACEPLPVSRNKVVLVAPASVIAQRPDLRVAERKLAAATAQQGVALAKFFPDISLTGFFGALNTSTSKLVTGGSESWLAGGSVLWPILSYGSLSANLDVADAQQQEAMAMYQKSVISALSDVERALTAYNEQDKFLQSALNEVEQDKHARAIADERYKNGLTSRLDVLDADRTLYDAQTRLIEARANYTQNLIAVYKSLGGGWAGG
jgi:NodT family efflux transporter outer membrane factor (OMF) lipoprotein